MNQLDSLMKELIDFNQSFRATIALNTQDQSSAEYVLMFGTLRIDTGRISGKSTWIANHANDDKALVIVSEAMIYRPLFETAALKCTLDDVWEGRCNSWSYDRIYVDCASYLLPTREDEHRLIEALVTHDQQMVVLVG